MSVIFSSLPRKHFSGPIRGIIFDWAGTTVDWGCFAPTGVFKEIFAEKGIEVTDAEVRLPMGKFKRDHIAEICSMSRVAELWIKIHGTACIEADIDKLFEAFVPKQLSVLTDCSKVVPELLDTVDELRRRKIKIGSTTGYSA